jgi:uncharacterized lipoprotein YajG
MQSNIGQGKKVALRVVDDREEQLIGHRVTGHGSKAAKIETKQDLVKLLKDSFIQGMRAKGFEPVEDSSSDISLKVELRSLTYDVTIGFWTSGNIGKATVKIIATNTSGKTYEKIYHSEKEIRTAFIGSQETNAKVINGALSDVLEKIFSDTGLWEFLH